MWARIWGRRGRVKEVSDVQIEFLENVKADLLL
jgi:hypothetical protein